IAYTYRLQGERAENSEEAIHHYRQALEVYTCTNFPEQWAGTQNSLANAYTSRLRGDRTENLEKAIQHYRQALEVHTPSAFPNDCRKTARNLGNMCFNE